MGHFDKSICDCCVCPMRCVLDQLRGQVIDIATGGPGAIVTVTLNDVKDFIAFTSEGNFPICQISAVRFDPVPGGIRLKSIKKSVGECACCEDPMTNLLNSMKEKIVFIEIIGVGVIGFVRIVDVGEGIVILFSEGIGVFFILSTCEVTRVIPTNQQQVVEVSKLFKFSSI